MIMSSCGCSSQNGCCTISRRTLQASLEKSKCLTELGASFICCEDLQCLGNRIDLCLPHLLTVLPVCICHGTLLLQFNHEPLISTQCLCGIFTIFLGLSNRLITICKELLFLLDGVFACKNLCFLCGLHISKSLCFGLLLTLSLGQIVFEC